MCGKNLLERSGACAYPPLCYSRIREENPRLFSNDQLRYVLACVRASPARAFHQTPPSKDAEFDRGKIKLKNLFLPKKIQSHLPVLFEWTIHFFPPSTHATPSSWRAAPKGDTQQNNLTTSSLPRASPVSRHSISVLPTTLLFITFEKQTWRYVPHIFFFAKSHHSPWTTVLVEAL